MIGSTGSFKWTFGTARLTLRSQATHPKHFIARFTTYKTKRQMQGKNNMNLHIRMPSFVI